MADLPWQQQFHALRAEQEAAAFPRIFLFPRVIAEWEQEREREKESACTCWPQIPPVTSSSTSPLQNFCCSSLLTTASHIRAPLTTAAVFSPGLQLLFYHICLTGCSVVNHCGQNQLAGVSPAHETMTLSTLWAWDSGFRIAVLVSWALRVALYTQSVLFLFSPRFVESRGILLEARGIWKMRLVQRCGLFLKITACGDRQRRDYWDWYLRW